MSRISDEGLLLPIAVLKPVERVIDRPHEAQDFTGHPRLGQALRHRGWPDCRSLRRCAGQRPQTDPDYDEIDDQENADKRQPYPGNVLHELFKNGVEDNLAVLENDLDPERSRRFRDLERYPKGCGFSVWQGVREEFPARVGIDWMKRVGQPLGSRYQGAGCRNNRELARPFTVIGCIRIGKLDYMSGRGLIKFRYEFGLSLKRSLMRLRVDVLEPDVKKHARHEHCRHRAEEKSKNQAEPK